MDMNFQTLPHLMEALVDSSPRTFVKWGRTPLENGASPIHAFKHYRHVLSIDGTHLYGKWTDLLHDKPEVRRWLEDMDIELLSQAFDTGGFRLGSMTTNASECFNDILKGDRDLPISSLVMFTFKQTTTYFVKRQRTPYDGQ
ncbi:hypothetical protein QQ045_014996 [Rhodiola kirilowii]